MAVSPLPLLSRGSVRVPGCSPGCTLWFSSVIGACPERGVAESKDALCGNACFCSSINPYFVPTATNRRAVWS